MGDLFSEIFFVMLEAERLRDSVLLAIKNHRNAVVSAGHGEPNERLERIDVGLLVMRDVVEQHETLSISAAPGLKYVLVVSGLGGELERENDILVENVEMPRRSVSHS